MNLEFIYILWALITKKLENSLIFPQITQRNTNNKYNFKIQCINNIPRQFISRLTVPSYNLIIISCKN